MDLSLYHNKQKPMRIRSDDTKRKQGEKCRVFMKGPSHVNDDPFPGDPAYRFKLLIPQSALPGTAVP